ncbi:hypothetical protein GCM10023184_28140 [Flaviaesturariibacter amylovorans]|uniref:Uncharacterized protein n=1 Tax=Flaviaesturariibacter amylovorans TaxID=1084520 RepID=A0ABP8H4I3_9BACT
MDGHEMMLTCLHPDRYMGALWDSADANKHFEGVADAVSYILVHCAESIVSHPGFRAHLKH